MTEIKHFKADGYIKQLPNTLKGALVFGADTGLVAERANAIASHIVPDVNDPFAVHQFQEDNLQEDPTVIGDALASMSLMGGRQLIRLNHVSKDIGKLMTEMWEHHADKCENFLLITAGDIKKTNGLRKLFEKDNQLAAIACYHDDSRDLAGIIRAELQQRGINAEADAIAFMAAHCQGDRMVVRSECEKVALFLGNDTQLTLGDVQAVIGKTTNSTLDDMTHAIMDANFKQLNSHFTKAMQQNIEPIAMLRHLLRYISRLSVVIDACQAGDTMDAAIKQLRPPLFFKTAPQFKKHVQRWQPKDRWRMVALLYEAEQCLKKGGTSYLMASRYLNRMVAIAK